MNDIVHAAVRRDLTRMEAALRAFPDGDVGRAHGLQRAWETLWRQLHHHHTGEDTYVWPYLKSLGVLDPELLDDMEREHRAMGSAMTAATAAIDDLALTPTADRALVAADLVARAHEVTDLHLVHEETDVVPVITERNETAEWKATEKQLRKAPPAFAGEFFAWVQDGADPETAAALRTLVPAPVTFLMPRLFGRRYVREVAPVWR